MSPAWRRWWLPVTLFAALTLTALAPIRSYDFFWHLATGRWIAEHHALPLTDPFAVASDRTEWINGEWLWQVLVHANYSAGGFTTITLIRAIEAALIFTLGYLFTRRDDVDGIALLAAAIAFAGAHERLEARPSSAAALLLVLGIIAIERLRPRAAVIAYALITIAWINIHPSAILAPLVPLILRRDRITTIASALALLVNPYGWKAIASPVQLTMYARSGAFVNAEWLPSPPLLFPLLYITIAIAIVVFAVAEDKRSAIWRFGLLAMFAVLAVQHVRNQGLYFAAFPLLVAPEFRRSIPRWWVVGAAAAVIAAVAVTTSHRIGIDAVRFPLRAVSALQRSPFDRGNVYNPDQFGGYLIWSFYPQRRALTDGRNELYHAYNGEYARARLDSRAWQTLLRKYRVDLAVDEYRPPLDTINATTGQHTTVPASLAYFPRHQWALIAYDDAAMVFVRRAAFSAADVNRWELKGVVPDRSLTISVEALCNASSAGQRRASTRSKAGRTMRSYRDSNDGCRSRIALRAQPTSERASRCETFVSLLIRFSVSSTIMRILRRRRRSKNPERSSAAGSTSYLGIVISRRERRYAVAQFRARVTDFQACSRSPSAQISSARSSAIRCS